MENDSITILHYTLGFNSDRGGGLTKYSTDLAEYQSKDNDVYLLYPGEIKLLSRMVRIKKNHKRNNITNYSIVNPLPIPFLYGIADSKYMSKKTNGRMWRGFLEDLKPDVIHIHTLIGLYKEFIDEAKSLEIPIVYSTHDYFGICPRQTLVYDDSICKEWKNCKNCRECNKYAITGWKQLALHSKTFLRLRNFKFIKKMRSNFKGTRELDKSTGNTPSVDFFALQQHFFEIFKEFDFFHFNSSITKNVFEKVMGHELNGDIIAVSHLGIKDNRKKKKFANGKLQLLYLGPPQQHKGYNFLLKLLDSIECKNFVLNTYTGINKTNEYVVDHGAGYNYSELGRILEMVDLLVVPSQWYETFGFIVIEALSYGVPVMATPNVGAADVIKQINEHFVLENDKWKPTIEKIIASREILERYNEDILSMKFETFSQHASRIMDVYRKVINEREI